jgi:phthalate 4,5-cis-dihydrodiol dehydrogenase
MVTRRLRLGIAGLGRAFSLMLPTLRDDPRVELVAGADPRPEARQRFSADFGAAGHDTVEALCADANVEAIYISTPHQFHRENVESAARHGKHAIVEKPMALSMQDCAAMIEACGRAGTILIVGHSHSFDAPIARTRALAASGAYGPLRMIQAMQYTDFLYRPRRPEELATTQGGGVIFNQAPHQVDNVRLIGGGRVKSVRAGVGRWDAARPTEGAYSAFLSFENGVFASLGYSGYAHFDSDELCDWIGESGLRKDPARYGEARAALRGIGGESEMELKQARNYGGPRYTPPGAGAPPMRWHEHFGLLVASCDKADLRPQPRGIMIYGDENRHFEELPPPTIPRVEVMNEFCDAIFDGRPVLHSGEWAMATMEVCFALLQSAREGREVVLHHQVGLPDESKPI